jgi:DNA-nicking Smr family endonuclease
VTQGFRFPAPRAKTVEGDMNGKKTSGSFKPFAHLGKLLPAGHAASRCKGRPGRWEEPDKPASPRVKLPPSAEILSDAELFQAVMTDVTPLDRTVKVGTRRPPPQSKDDPMEGPEAEAVEQLRQLVSDGTGFRVELTPEYMEGTGWKVPPETSRRLHRGEFSIQDHIDLHGLTAAEAREAFNGFLRRAVRTGKRGVLVVHGRGLSSPERPVLKAKVQEWLSNSPWNRWVIAFASARRVDGGAGATYVLLRSRKAEKCRRPRAGGKR